MALELATMRPIMSQRASQPASDQVSLPDRLLQVAPAGGVAHQVDRALEVFEGVGQLPVRVVVPHEDHGVGRAGEALVTPEHADVDLAGPDLLEEGLPDVA